MGYDLHITRAEDWLDSANAPITDAEWMAYAASDAELRVEGSYRTSSPGGTIEHPIFGWTCDKTGRKGALWHEDSHVAAKNPDPEFIKKMYRIATGLNARLQGDDGEIYGPDGEPV